MTEILDVVDWSRLPQESKPIAAMLEAGHTQVEIARTMGMTDDQVGTLLDRLALSLVEQALEHVDELSPKFRAHLQELRGSTAMSAAGAPTRSLRTADQAGTSRTTA